MGISCDSVESHERWIATPQARGGLGGLSFPLASDRDGIAARSYRVYDERQGVTVRGLFIIDPQGLVQYQVVHNLSVGRRSQEILRLTRFQSGGLCREDWMTDHQVFDPFTALRPGNYFSHYLIEAEVGSGTFARVYRARDLQLDRPVALKVFKPDCPVTPSAALAEARAAAALNHPNLCTIYAVDDTAGIPIIAMEYIAGRPLSQHARGPAFARFAPLDRPPDRRGDGRRPRGRDRARRPQARECDGHRGGPREGPRLQIARRLRRNAPVSSDDTAELGLAEQGDGLFGTPRFLAPEQVRGEPACQASDVFALGLILYELATGKMAFPGGNLLQILDQIRSVDPEPLAAEAPDPLSGILRRLLIRDPLARTITMREVTETLLASVDLAAMPFPGLIEAAL